jgi:hypothetical protein
MKKYFNFFTRKTSAKGTSSSNQARVKTHTLPVEQKRAVLQQGAKRFNKDFASAIEALARE